jgi:hypothetical protein
VEFFLVDWVLEELQLDHLSQETQEIQKQLTKTSQLQEQPRVELELQEHVAHLPPKIKIFNLVEQETLQHLERRMSKASQEQEALPKIKIKTCNLEEELEEQEKDPQEKRVAQEKDWD